uniref:DH domain-containing protein n=1 Tax=Romanomermis culicivorax TaxID=13658 RepID=A0A915JI97_ROMCU
MTAETTSPSIFPVDLLQQHQEFLENDNKSKISAKWRSCFLETLREISRQVNPPTFSLNQDACFYVEDLLFTLLTRIFDIKPLCIGDVTKFVLKTFPEPLNRWSIDDAQKIFLNNTNHHKRNNYAARLLTFPNNKVYAMLKEVYNYRFDAQVVNYVLSILQYIAQDVLRLTGNYVKNIRHTIITFQDLKVAMTADNVLMDLFFRDEDQDLNSPAVDFLLEEQHLSSPLFADNLNYEQSVKSLIHQETQYLRDLNMLIFVFHENFKRIDNKNLYENENFLNLERIFGNLFDVKDFTIRFCALLEDKLDIEREENLQVGVCFAEMAQAYEFDVYHMYIQNIMNPQTMEYIQNLTVKNRILADELEDIQPGFKLAVKYLLPQLLLLPVKHCAEYFDYITSLKKLATSEDDLNDFSDAESLLLMLKKRLDTHANSLVRQILPNKLTQNVSPNARCAAAKSKLNALCKQGPLCKYSSQPKLGSSLLGATDTLRKGSRCATTSRYAYLFDNMLILCKSVGPSMSSSMTLTADSVVATSPKCLKFKEYLSIRRLEVLDRDDLEDVKYAFEIRTKAASSQQQNSESLESGIVLSTKSAIDKQTWMSNLVTLQMRSTLERMLDASLSAEEERIPLILPSVEQYRFAEKDSEENIVFEDYVSSSGLPIVRGATLPKLVERLTYNQYS